MTVTDLPKYTDFRGDHHAAKGHWNDPPKAIFKPQPPKAGAPPKDPKKTTTNEDSPPTTAETKAKGNAKAAAAALEPEEVTPIAKEDAQASIERLLQTLRAKELQGMDKRKLEDATKKMDLLFARLKEDQVAQPVLLELTNIVTALEAGKNDEASRLFLPLMQHYVETEGKWLLGLRRLIELA
ncbi:hypothetical protein H4R33_006834 [Dimargaris cristalligena]|uniref:Uncharacterized protein n=1 Tax=Dimargaris cristalligena TaxID=215637 RepID=A0A4Q0A0B5_9FUNG|nr:hypothetical protein H4R33_006834 [Dimargaris cristalligena]RKP39158.1 hypothetical protein BJ085DRAFT_33640 [Dimargaris cristalligena]|eukprot:RKP39158.1 hypothetical protein BJ085DRAFT_33640 [Dimargaris cristalligena]